MTEVPPPNVAPAEGKLGVLTVGLGAVASTLIAGVELAKRGMALPIGSLAEMGTIRLGRRTDNRVPLIKDFVPLASLDDLVFGAWDPFPDDAYVAAQRLYARRPHDGKPAGLYARQFASDPGKQNGLYWPVTRGEPHSPLGPLVAEAEAEGRQLGTGESRLPFHGYYFRILEGQGPAAQGGARDYVVKREMSGGFALVAWPAQYDVTGIMTFMVNQDGVVYEKDLGPDTATAVTQITRFDPDKTWQRSSTPEEGSR